MIDKLTDEQQKALYWSLLKGLAKDAQNQLCAADTLHDWSPWHQTKLEHDIPPRAIDLNEPMACTETFHVRSDRHCLNCGKKQMA